MSESAALEQMRDLGRIFRDVQESFRRDQEKTASDVADDGDHPTKGQARKIDRTHAAQFVQPANGLCKLHSSKPL